jgi:hypothetical protein
LIHLHRVNHLLSKFITNHDEICRDFLSSILMKGLQCWSCLGWKIFLILCRYSSATIFVNHLNYYMTNPIPLTSIKFIIVMMRSMIGCFSYISFKAIFTHIFILGMMIYFLNFYLHLSYLFPTDEVILSSWVGDLVWDLSSRVRMSYSLCIHYFKYNNYSRTL